MSLIFPDKVKITPININTVFNTEEQGTPFFSKANIEEEGKVRYNSNGEIIDPFIVIILPKGISIDRGDYIKIIKLNKKEPTTHEVISRKVIQASRRFNFGIGQIEVLV